MRVLAFACVLLGLPAAAWAAPVHRPDSFDSDLVYANRPRLIMPGEFSYSSVASSQEPPILGLGRSQSDASASTGLSFGPLHAESEIVNGHRRMHYRINGFSLMGGEIGGSVSRHGAILTLHWGD